MSSIRNDGQEVRRRGDRAHRSENLKEAPTSQATSSTAASDTTITPTSTPAGDRVNLPETQRDEGPSRDLPNLMAWGEGAVDAASDLATRAVDGAKSLWDGAKEALGFGDQSAQRPEGQSTPSAETSQDASNKVDPGAQEPASANGNTTSDNVSQTGGAEQANPNQTTDKPKPPQLQGIPPRPEDARGGKEFMESIKNLKPGPERDKAILDEIMKGNIPDNLRDLKEVNVSRKGKDGQSHDLTMHVMPDYLSIGSNEDNVRIPMTPAVAQAIADRTGTSLPTDRMVDDIHSNADKKLNMDPFQWKPGNEHARNMQSVDWYQQHDQRIDNQLGTGQAQTGIVSGHKKDLVIPNKDGKVAIYGGTWPGTDKRIQPYSNLHENTYEDYSHGARLVSQDVVIDGKAMKLSDVLADPNLAPLVTRFPPSANGEPAGLHNRYSVPDRLR